MPSRYQVSCCPAVAGEAAAQGRPKEVTAPENKLLSDVQTRVEPEKEVLNVLNCHAPHQFVVLHVFIAQVIACRKRLPGYSCIVALDRDESKHSPALKCNHGNVSDSQLPNLMFTDSNW